MGIKDKAKELRDKAMQSGKVDEYVDKAREKAGQATGHRFDEQLDKGAEAAKGAARRQPDEQSPADDQEHPS